MNKRFDYFHQVVDPDFYLCNPDQKGIGVLKAENRNVTLRLNSLSELKFTVSKSTNSEIIADTGESLYEMVRTKRLVLVEDIGWFQITNIEEIASGAHEYKEVTCESHQTILKTAGFVSEERPYGFYNPDDPTDAYYDAGDISLIPTVVGQLVTQLGIKLDIHDTDEDIDVDYKQWTITYIDDDLKFYRSDPTSIVRTFKTDNTYGYDFIINSVEPGFEVIFDFDILHHAIKIKRFEEITIPTDIYLSFENIVNTLTVKEDAEDIITVLNCTAGDSDISFVNPMGTPYIVDFSYYMQKSPSTNGGYTYPWMSKNLIDTINDWEYVWNESKAPYKAYISTLQSKYTDLSTQNIELQRANLELDDYQRWIDECIKNPSLKKTLGVVNRVIIGDESVDEQDFIDYDTTVRVYEVQPYLNSETDTFFYDTSDGKNKLVSQVSDSFIESFDPMAEEKESTGLYFMYNNERSFCEFTIGEDFGISKTLEGGNIQIANNKTGYVDVGKVKFEVEYSNLSVPRVTVVTKVELDEEGNYVLEYGDEFELGGDRGLSFIYDGSKYYLQRSADNYVTIYRYKITGYKRMSLSEDAGTITFDGNPSGWIKRLTQNVLSIEASIKNLQDDITAFNRKLKEISEACNIKEYIKKHGGDDIYQEFLSYWVEGTYENNAFSVTANTSISDRFELMKALMDVAAAELVKVSQPKLTLEVDAINFTTLSEFKAFTDQLELGRLITVEKRDGIYYRPALVSMTINLDDPTDFSLGFSSSSNLKDAAMTIADLLNQSVSTSRTLNANWDKITEFSNKKEEMMELLKNPLDRTLRMMNENMSNQEFVVDESGILGRRLKSESQVDYYPEQVRLINNLLVFTDDGWETAKLALGKITYDDGGETKSGYGLIADAIIGNLILGEKIKVVNSSTDYSTITLDAKGLSIRKKDGTLVFNANTDGEIYVRNHSSDEKLSTMISEEIGKISLGVYATKSELESYKATVDINLDGVSTTVQSISASVEELEQFKTEITQDATSLIEQGLANIDLSVYLGENIATKDDIGTLESHIADYESSIDLAVGSITSKVTAVEEDTANIRGTIFDEDGNANVYTKAEVYTKREADSKIEQTAESITSTVESLQTSVQTLEGAVESIYEDATTIIEQGLKGIDLVAMLGEEIVKKDELTGITEEITNNVKSSINITLDGITQSVSQVQEDITTIAGNISSIEGSVDDIEYNLDEINGAIFDEDGTMKIYTKTEVGAAITTAIDGINLSSYAKTKDIEGFITEDKASEMFITSDEISAYVKQEDGNEEKTFGYALTKDEFSISSNGENVMSVTEDGLSIKGSIEAIAGEIGGFTIESTTDNNGATTTWLYAQSDAGLYSGLIGSGGHETPSLFNPENTSPVVFYAGSTDNNPYPEVENNTAFAVLEDGSVYMTACKIVGNNVYINVGDNFVVNEDGDVTINGKIEWGDDASPVQALYNKTFATNPSTQYAYGDYPSEDDGTKNGWHKNFSNDDYYASYTYNGGKSWTSAVLVRATVSSGEGDEEGSISNVTVALQTAYKLSNTINSVAAPTSDSSYPPTGWQESPPDVTADNPFSFVTTRTVVSIDGVVTNGDWSSPSIHAIYKIEDASSIAETIDIFNLLTTNGKTQGAFKDVNGNLYVNAEYIQTGSIASDITFAGNIIATKGTIGSFTLENGSLYYGVTSFDDDENDGIYIGKEGIRLGKDFCVDSTGLVTATGLKIKLSPEQMEDLKGDPGYTPIKGVDYFDGHTPEKGVDYFDGYTPVKDVDYFDGKSSYTHIVYSDYPTGVDEDGNPAFVKETDDSKAYKYIGIYTDDNQNAPEDPDAYSWHLFKGDKGDSYKVVSLYLRLLSQSTIDPPVYNGVGEPSGGWTTTPTGVDSLYLFEYVSQSEVINGVYQGFSTPVIYARYSGTVRIAYLYHVQETSTPPERPEYTGSQVLSGWAFEPQATDERNKYQFVSQCTVTNNSYGRWSTPVVYSIYSVDGKNTTETVTDTNVFNALTKNGEVFGCFGSEDGKLYINAAYIKGGTIESGLIFAGSVTATNGKIAGLTMESLKLADDSICDITYVTSGELCSGINGKNSGTFQSLVDVDDVSEIRFYAGSTTKDPYEDDEDNSAPNFYVLEDGSLYASAAKISGNITADSGKIAGFSINKDEVNGKVTNYLSAHSEQDKYVGILGYSDNPSAKLRSVVNPSNASTVRIFSGSATELPSGLNPPKFYVLEDGSLYAEAAMISGNINANSGNIAGWEIGEVSVPIVGINGSVTAKYLRSGTSRLESGTSSYVGMLGNNAILFPSLAGSDGSSLKIYAGSSSPVPSMKMSLVNGRPVYSTDTLPKFAVLEDGSLYAAAAKISGEITATSGTIAGFNIKETESGGAIYTNGKDSYDSTTAGVYIGTDGINLGEGKFKVSNAGALHAESGEIANFNITSTSLYSGTKSSFNSDDEGVYIGEDGISYKGISPISKSVGNVKITKYGSFEATSIRGGELREYNYKAQQRGVSDPYVPLIASVNELLPNLATGGVLGNEAVTCVYVNKKTITGDKFEFIDLDNYFADIFAVVATGDNELKTNFSFGVTGGAFAYPAKKDGKIGVYIGNDNGAESTIYYVVYGR